MFKDTDKFDGMNDNFFDFSHFCKIFLILYKFYNNKTIYRKSSKS
jgi:hypothetical protein